MKKLVISAVVIGLLAGAMVAPAEAGKKKKKPPVPAAPVRIERVVEIPYTGGNAGVATPAATGGACFNGQPVFTCQSVASAAEETYIKIEVKDASGQNAGGFISQNDNDGDGLQDGYGQFCGAHAEAVPLETPGGLVAISLYPGVCSDASGPSVVTSGTIVVTFSNMP